MFEGEWLSWLIERQKLLTSEILRNSDAELLAPWNSSLIEISQSFFPSQFYWNFNFQQLPIFFIVCRAQLIFYFLPKFGFANKIRLFTRRTATRRGLMCRYCQGSTWHVGRPCTSCHSSIRQNFAPISGQNYFWTLPPSLVVHTWH